VITATDLGGNLHTVLPYQTHLVDSQDGRWIGALMDGSFSPEERFLEAVYSQAVRDSRSFCLVFLNDAMLQDFLDDKSKPLAPLQEFVRYARHYEGAPVLVLSELSEILGVDLDEFVMEHYAWYTTMNLVSVSDRMARMMVTSSLRDACSWSPSQWADSSVYRFHHAQRMALGRARLRVLLGKEQSVIKGTRRAYALEEGRVAFDTLLTDCTFVLNDLDGKRVLTFNGLDALRDDLGTKELPFEGVLYQLKLLTLPPHTDGNGAAMNGVQLPLVTPLDIQAANQLANS